MSEDNAVSQAHEASEVVERRLLFAISAFGLFSCTIFVLGMFQLTVHPPLSQRTFVAQLAAQEDLVSTLVFNTQNTKDALEELRRQQEAIAKLAPRMPDAAAGQMQDALRRID